MMLLEHNQESFDSMLSRNEMRMRELERDRTQQSARLEEMGQRLSGLESSLDAQKQEQERVLRRLDQIEVAVRDSLKSSQAELQESLDKNLADARQAGQSDVQVLRADVARINQNQEKMVGDLNRALEAMRRDLERFNREIDKVYTEVPKMLERATGGGAAAAPSSSGKRYVVQPGDTLSGIARDHGVTLEALRAANGMTPGSVLQSGRELIIP